MSSSTPSSSTISAWENAWESWRIRLLPLVLNGTSTVMAFQKLCGVKTLKITDTQGNGDVTPLSPSSSSSSSSSSSKSLSSLNRRFSLSETNVLRTAEKAEEKRAAAAEITTTTAAAAEEEKNDDDDDDDVMSRYEKEKEGIVNFAITNRFFYYFFSCAAAVGNEEFYIFVLPFLFWCVDVSLARRIIQIWVAVYFVGQSIKDKLRLPRPPSPPVVRIEKHYAAEYGLPSTHAMISLALPFYILLVTHPQFSYDYTFGFLVALFWTSSVCCSRLYMGVHTVADIISGLALGVLLVIVYGMIGDWLDRYNVTSAYAPLLSLLCSVVSILGYPAPAKWTNAYGDTALIIGTANGVVWGSSSLLSHMGHAAVGFSFVLVDNPVSDIVKTTQTALSSGFTIRVEIGRCVLRVMVGYAVMLATRLVGKVVMANVMMAVHKLLGKHVVDPKKTYSVEIPSKFCVYTAIGFNAAYTAFVIFGLLGI